MTHATLESVLDRQGRREDARERMAAEGLDALLLTGGPNLTYLAGVSGMLGANSGSRPLLYVLPRDGTPVLVVHRFLAGNVLDDPTAVRIQTYDRLSAFPTAALQDALEQVGVTDGRIGAELGPETTLSVPAQAFIEFTERLPDAEFVDAHELLVDLRCRKSPQEVERIELACDITAEAFDRVFDEIEDGMTGATVESLVCQQLFDCGGQSPWALVTTGSENYDQTASGGDDYHATRGDMVWIDCGCAVDGYWSDYSRAGVIGGPSDRQREAQQAIHEITRDTVDAIEPGASIATVSRQAEAAVQALDLPVTAYLSEQAGRIGHALGLQVTELPSLSANTDRSFEPGMVVTVEPAVATDYGTFHVEENVVVTTDGTRTLSADRWRLRTI